MTIRNIIDGAVEQKESPVMSLVCGILTLSAIALLLVVIVSVFGPNLS